MAHSRSTVAGETAESQLHDARSTSTSRCVSLAPGQEEPGDVVHAGVVCHRISSRVALHVVFQVERTAVAISLNLASIMGQGSRPLVDGKAL